MFQLDEILNIERESLRVKETWPVYDISRINQLEDYNRRVKILKNISTLVTSSQTKYIYRLSGVRAGLARKIGYIQSTISWVWDKMLWRGFQL